MTDTSRPAIDAASVETHVGSGYPAPFAADCARREKRRLGDAFGLTQFGVNLVRLPPGQWASQRHWHTLEDEFVYMLAGELVLVTDAGEQAVTPGMVMGFKAGVKDGHHLVNRSDRDAVFLEVGTRDAADEVDYPDIDMLVRIVDGAARFVHRDGTPYDDE
ncbi:MAG: cupin domain-containing protein [Rhodospirillales bacterium]|nr:MAG: cupin domain-containing protein [Rhodospirillales bacterium]